MPGLEVEVNAVAAKLEAAYGLQSDLGGVTASASSGSLNASSLVLAGNSNPTSNSLAGKLKMNPSQSLDDMKQKMMGKLFSSNKQGSDSNGASSSGSPNSQRFWKK